MKRAIPLMTRLLLAISVISIAMVVSCTRRKPPITMAPPEAVTAQPTQVAVVPTDTPTLVAPTLTPTPTIVVQPTASPTLMLVTPTPVVPTDTPQPEPTVTPEESPTPEATATPTPQPEQPTATPTFSLPTTGFPYTVKKGDNLFRIALRFNTTVAAIASLNGISDPRQIVTGQTLIIPGTPSQMTYVVKPGDTLYSIARRHGTTVQAIVDANNITDRTKIYTGQKLIIPSTGTTPPTTTRTYTVKPGDTLYSIARRHGTTVQAIAQANNLRDPTSIFVGQVLRIP